MLKFRTELVGEQWTETVNIAESESSPNLELAGYDTASSLIFRVRGYQ